MKNIIAELRKAGGTKQEALANAVGVSRQTIISIEKGSCNPSVMLAIRIARFFDMPVEAVFLPDENELWRSRPDNNKNYPKNKEKTPKGIVFGQSVCSDIYYGRFPLSYNGGEPIAVYNALILSRRPAELCDIVLELEENELMTPAGIFGTDPRRLGVYLAAHGIPFKFFGDTAALKNDVAEHPHGVYIYSYSDKKCPLEAKGLHTVAMLSRAGALEVYNLSDTDTEASVFPSTDEFFSHRSMIVAYRLQVNKAPCR